VLKYLLSSSDVKFRPPYGKTIKQYRRYTSFIGTTNQMQLLAGNHGDPFYLCQSLRLLRCEKGDTHCLGQVDE
jgi:predicted P-loop ATPase